MSKHKDPLYYFILFFFNLKVIVPVTCFIFGMYLAVVSFYFGRSCASQILVPQPKIQPMHPAVGSGNAVLTTGLLGKFLAVVASSNSCFPVLRCKLCEQYICILLFFDHPWGISPYSSSLLAVFLKILSGC